MKFSPADDTAMWNWCIEHPLGDSMQKFWEDYVVASNSPRSVKSIRERFRRHVLPLLHLTTFSDEVKLELYKKMRAPINTEYMQHLHGDWDIELDEHGFVIGYSPRLYNILNDYQQQAPPPLMMSTFESSGPLVPELSEHSDEEQEEDLNMGLFRMANEPTRHVAFKPEPTVLGEEPVEHLEALSIEQFLQEHHEHQNLQNHEEHPEEHPEELVAPTPDIAPFLEAIKATVASVVASTINEHLEHIQIRKTIEEAVSHELAVPKKKGAELVDPKKFLVGLKRLAEQLEIQEIEHRINAAIAKLATVEKKIREDKLQLVMEMLLEVVDVEHLDN